MQTAFQSLYIATVFLSSTASCCVSSDVKSWKTSILFDHADDIYVGFDDKNAGAGVDDGNDQGKQCFCYRKNSLKYFVRCVIANLRQKICFTRICKFMMTKMSHFEEKKLTFV